MRILVTDGIDSAAAATLQAQGYDIVTQFFEPDALGAALQEFDAVVVRSKTKIRVNHIDEAKAGRLKLIIRGGVGTDNIDVDYAHQCGITVRNTPNASSVSVAELAMGHMLSCARFLSDAGHTMREGRWEKKAYGKGVEISGKTLGIIGFGRIGRKLAQMACAFEMQVLVYDRKILPELEQELGVRYVSLDTLYSVCDFISIHTPASDNGPLICKASIDKMKDGVILINTSRGSNVDESALLDALNSGKVFAAGLDVYEQEPPQNNPLLHHPRVSCTPHIGGATQEAQRRIGEEIVQIINSYFG